MNEPLKYVLAVLLQIVLIFLNAIFASAEIAVISMTETKLAMLAEKGKKQAKQAKRINKLTADPAKFLSTIQVAITLAGFLGSAFAADLFAQPLANAICGTWVTDPTAIGAINTACVVVITLILAFFNIVFGELVPKRVAMNHAEGVSSKLSGLLLAVSVIFKPIVWLLTISTNGVLRMFGIKPEDDGERVTEEEIVMMAEAGSEKGSIESEETELIKNIFDFKDLSIGEISTHRKDADILFQNNTDEQWEELIYSTNHTYYPVCGDNVDDVVGVLFTKDYFRLKDKSRKSVMKNAVQKPVFIYENAAANSVFTQMKTTHDYFAVVIDEYGGMAGIVTIHDLLEAIVGDMDDKGEEAEYTIEQLEGGVWEINGLAPLAKVEDALDIKLPEEDSDTYETFGGYICGLTGTLPEDGSTFELSTEQMEISVLAVEDKCITKVRIKLKVTDEEKE